MNSLDWKPDPPPHAPESVESMRGRLSAALDPFYTLDALALGTAPPVGAAGCFDSPNGIRLTVTRQETNGDGSVVLASVQPGGAVCRENAEARRRGGAREAAQNSIDRIVDLVNDLLEDADAETVAVRFVGAYRLPLMHVRPSPEFWARMGLDARGLRPRAVRNNAC
jgi:hypothetical protein